MVNVSKPRFDKKSRKTKVKSDSGAKHGVEPAQAKKGKGKAKAGFEEAVLSLGGNRDDIALLKDVSADGELVQGEQETDVRMTLQASMYSICALLVTYFALCLSPNYQTTCQNFCRG